MQRPRFVPVSTYRLQIHPAFPFNAARDVLANGPEAPSAHFFDIDWNPFKTELRRKLLLPILGDQYGWVLERGELQLQFGDDQLLLAYGDHRLPINARHVAELHGLPDL